MCMCVCAWVCACDHAWVRGCASVRVCVHRCACMCACMGVSVHGCMCVRAWVCVHTWVCILGYTCVHGYVCMGALCMHGCMCVRTGVCACVCGFGMIKTLGEEADSAMAWWTTLKDDSPSLFIFGLDKFQTASTVMRQAVQWLTSLRSCPVILCTWRTCVLKEQRPAVDWSRAGGLPRWTAYAHKS